MSSPTPQRADNATLRAYVRCLARLGGPGLALGAVLVIAIALLEGVGLTMLLPLLKSIGVRGGAGGPAAIAAMILKHGRIPEGLLPVLGVLLGVKLAQAGLRAWSGALNLRLETRITIALREQFYRALVRANWLFHSRQRASDISHTLMGELQVAGSGVQMLLGFLSLIVMAVVQLVIGISLSPVLAALTLVVGAGIAWGLRRLRKNLLGIGELSREKQREMNAAVSEHLAGIKVAKSHGREGHHYDRFCRAMEGIAEHTRQAQKISRLAGIWLQVGSVAGMALLVACAIGIFKMNPAGLIVLGYIFSRLQGVQTSIQTSWQRMLQILPSFAAAEKMRAELDAAAEPPEPAEAGRMALARAVRLEHVSFRYGPDLPPAVQDIDLTIPAKRVVALCGHSGAGKSTIADLILGLLTPAEGRVLVDGVPLAGPRLHDWRRSIGYVPQETFLFHDSVRANLLWARPEAGEAELWEVLRSAAAEGFVRKMKEGIETVLGDRGVRLSGGERQRIALARALLRKPTLLVLDEATSALDAENERFVKEAIERLHGGLAIVIIAHRLSTVRMADEIAVIKEGRVVETGSWEDLAGRERGAFRQLLAAGGLSMTGA